MLHCARCGSSLHSERNHRGNARYRERHGIECDTNGRTLGAFRIDPQIGDIFASIRLGDVDPDAIARAASTTPHVPDVGQLRAERRRIGAAFVDGILPEAEYRERLEEVDRRIRLAEQQPDITLTEAVDALRDLRDLWHDADHEQRRRLLSQLVRRVYLDVESAQVVALEPEPPIHSLLRAAVESTPEAKCTLVLGEDCEPEHEVVGWWRRGRLQLCHPYIASGR